MSRLSSGQARWPVVPLFVLFLVGLGACAQRVPTKHLSESKAGSGAREAYPGPRIDNVFFAKNPGHRVGAGVRRVVLLGRGEMSETNVRGMQNAFEGIGGVEAVVPSDDEAKEIVGMLHGDTIPLHALDRMRSCCKADHLLLMISSLTPYEEYLHGGTAVFRVVARIVDLSTGAVRYETAASHGVEYPAPEKYGMPDAHVPRLSPGWIEILNLSVMSELSYELRYAVGGTHDGTIPYSSLLPGICVVASVLKGSPADLAGVRMNDTILKKGETGAQDSSFCRFAPFGQGSSVPYRILRDGKEMEVWLAFPAFPGAE